MFNMIIITLKTPIFLLCHVSQPVKFKDLASNLTNLNYHHQAVDHVSYLNYFAVFASYTWLLRIAIQE